MGMLLSSTPLRSGMTEGRLSRVRRGSLWSTYGVREAARRLVIPPQPSPPPPPPLPFLPTLSSPPPHHDKPDLLSIKEPQATSPFRPPLSPFLPSGPHPICHLHRLGLGQLKGTRCRCQARPGGGRGGWQRKGSRFPPWQRLGSLLMGLGTSANLLISFTCGAPCQAAWSGSRVERISTETFLNP